MSGALYAAKVREVDGYATRQPFLLIPYAMSGSCQQIIGGHHPGAPTIIDLNPNNKWKLILIHLSDGRFCGVTYEKCQDQCCYAKRYFHSALAMLNIELITKFGCYHAGEPFF